MPAINPAFGLFMVIFSVIGSPSSELFLMISSSLLVPTKQNMSSFYKKRFSKLIGPFLFWSIIILIIQYLLDEQTLKELFYNIILFPLAPVTGVYWFVYTICGLYLIIPIISPWLIKSTKKELLTVIIIWAITLLLPYLNLILDKDIYRLKGDYYFSLVYFGGFIGYLFLGVFLKKYPLLFSNKYKAFVFINILLLAGALPILYGYLINRNALLISEENLSISSALFVTAIFAFFQNFKIPTFIENSLNIIAKYSFGIYLIHFIILKGIKHLLEHHRLPHPILETPLIAISCLLISLLIIRFIALFPIGKHIVGVYSPVTDLRSSLTKKELYSNTPTAPDPIKN